MLQVLVCSRSPAMPAGIGVDSRKRYGVGGSRFPRCPWGWGAFLLCDALYAVLEFGKLDLLEFASRFGKVAGKRLP